MPDMLCALRDLPTPAPLLRDLEAQGITVRRPHPWEKSALRTFNQTHFPGGWADECDVAFTHQPVTAYIALDGEGIVGFAVYECTRRNYFGPTGVAESHRGKGLGKVLLLAALWGLWEMGYAYAIIGGAGPVEFYTKAVGAVPVPFAEGRGIYNLPTDPALYR